MAGEDTASASRWRRWRSALTAPPVLFSLIWQVFLIYPVLAVVLAGASTGATVLGLVAIAAFSAVYLAGFASPAVTDDYPLHVRRRGRGGEDWAPAATRDTAPAGWPYLAGLVLCSLGTAPAAGLNGPMNFLPFLACFIAAAWPLRRSVPAAIGLIALGAGAAYLESRPGMLIPAFLVIPVVMSMIGTRISVGVSVREGSLRRALGVAEERERVARDLHDVLGHTLTALTIRAQLARARLDSDPEAARRELENIEDLTRTALTEMRQTVSGLRVADPGQELDGFTRALRTAGIEVTVTGDPEAVAAEHRELVAWTLREAGTNIVRHSGAGRATVEFDGDGVRITDDGVGIGTRRAQDARAGRAQDATAEQVQDASAGQRHGASAGQGLRGLADRASACGATLTVHDRGTGPAAHDTATGTVLELAWSR